MPVKLEWLGYRMVEKLWRYVKPFSYNTSVSRTDRRTDRRTDGRTDRITISISRVSSSMLTRDKNAPKQKKNYCSECGAPKFVGSLFRWKVWTFLNLLILPVYELSLTKINQCRNRCYKCIVKALFSSFCDMKSINCASSRKLSSICWIFGTSNILTYFAGSLSHVCFSLLTEPWPSPLRMANMELKFLPARKWSATTNHSIRIYKHQNSNN